MNFSKLKSYRTQIILPITGPSLNSVHPYQAESALQCLCQAVVDAQCTISKFTLPPSALIDPNMKNPI